MQKYDEVLFKSYCPYSEAISGELWRYGQALLDYCIDEKYALSVCCSPCVCHLGSGKNKSTNVPYKILDYRKNKSDLYVLEGVLHEGVLLSNNIDVSSKKYMWRPVSYLSFCNEGKSISFSRSLDVDFHKTCTPNSYDPMRGA